MSSLQLLHRPIASVAESLEQSSFGTQLCNPWVCQLNPNEDHNESFGDRIVQLVEGLEVCSD